ncbi:MAG: copper chaperone PCu(A)C [Geminicoccaceae bacterium]
MKTSALLALVTAGLLAAGIATAAETAKLGPIGIDDAWARAAPAGMANSAAYMKLENGGAEADKLVSASSPAADMVGLHATTVDSSGVAQMREVEGIEVPAGGSVELAPGGLHVMLMGLKQPLAAGGTLPLTLVFEHAGSVTLDVPVQAATGGMAGMKHDHNQQSTSP